MLHADQAPIRCARLTQSGTLRASPRSRLWMRFDSIQEIAPPAVSFDWDARVRFGPLVHLRVRDSLLEGRAARIGAWSACSTRAK